MRDYSQSQAAYERAATIPGRSLTCSKAPGRFYDVGEGPLYAIGGSGATLIDVDGRPYIDMLCALGAISLGYDVGEPSLSFSLPHAAEGQAADAILAHVAPWASCVRFTKTGSEATHAALAVARKATGRTGYARLKGSYHGWHLIWQDDAPDVTWFHVGESPSGAELDRVAAVFVEPPRWEACSRGWLDEIAQQARAHGALLVFDSMIYGGRFALGGASEYFNVEPDLECFGKAIGNGASVACVVGRDALAAHGAIASGTYSGDIGGLQATCRTIQRYATEPVMNTLWARGRQLADGLDRAIQDTGMSDRVTREGAPVHQRLRFTGDDITKPVIGKQFAAEMVKRGVLWHPQVCNVMAAHTPEQIDQVIMAAAESLRALR